MQFLFTIICILFIHTLEAQDVNNIVKDGNEAYKKADYKNAVEFYKKVLGKDAKNSAAKFNLANALQKQNNFKDAEKYYDEAADISDIDLKAKALYNKGLSQVQQQKLTDAVEAFKQSLMLSPNDNDTRENLQKAINELKKKQQSQPQQQDKKDQSKPRQDKNNNKQPDKEMMEQKFNELRDKEKQLQKMLQKKTNMEQPDKDW